MKYKVGDRVKVKSPSWFNENKYRKGIRMLPEHIAQFCGKVLTVVGIREDGSYRLSEDADGWYWRDWMLEKLDI